jgi:RNA polymerase-binding transcription factor DksA
MVITMAQTGPDPRETQLHQPVFRPRLPVRTRASYADLRIELRRRQAALVREANLDGIQAAGSEHSSDPADQASVDQEQEWSLLVTAQCRDKVRQIDMALDRIARHSYGLCVRCRKRIPMPVSECSRPRTTAPPARHSKSKTALPPGRRPNQIPSMREEHQDRRLHKGEHYALRPLRRVAGTRHCGGWRDESDGLSLHSLRRRRRRGDLSQPSTPTLSATE